MGLFDGFPFKSSKQVQQEAQDFERRVLPFGPAQKEVALALLQQLVTGKRVQDSDRLFAFFSAKDAYTKEEDKEEGLVRARAVLKKHERMVSEEDQKKVLVLVVLDSALESLNAYPTVADVQSAAATL